MERIFTIDKDQILKYKFRNILRVIKMIGIILIVFVLINFLSNQNDWKPLIITALLILGIVMFVSILSLFKPESALESYTIQLNHDYIIRAGKLYPSDSINTKIEISSIDKLKKTTNGYLLYKKGGKKSLEFHPYKMIGIYDNDIIWVPYILKNFDELIEFLRRNER